MAASDADHWPPVSHRGHVPCVCGYVCVLAVHRPHMLHGDESSSSGGGDGDGIRIGIGGDATAIRYAPYHVPLLAPSP